MGVSEQLDKHFSTHGNWQGLSLGWLAIVWLSYILSQGDHCLSHVQPWVEKRLQTIRRCIDWELRALDFSDDRLEAVWTGNQELTSIEYTYANGEKKEIALGYGRSRPRTTLLNGSEVTWTERQLVVQSLAVASKGEKSLRTRLGKAQEALLELGQSGRGKKRLTQLIEWQTAVSEICQRYRVEGLLMVEISVSTP